MTRASRRLAAARTAAADLRVDAGTWLDLRRQRLADGARRAAFRLFGWLLLGLVLVVVTVTGAVMVLVGAAGSLATGLGLGFGTTAMLVGLTALVSTAALVALGRRGGDREALGRAEARLQRSMGESLGRIGRSVWTLPGLIVVATAGFVSVRALRDRRLRRLLVIGLGALRTTGRVLGRVGGPATRAAG